MEEKRKKIYIKRVEVGIGERKRKIQRERRK